MVSIRNSEWLLSKLLTLPVFIVIFLIGITLLSVLVRHWKTMNKFYRTVLVLLCVLAFVLVFALVGLSLAFGKSPHPPSPPMPN